MIKTITDAVKGLVTSKNPPEKIDWLLVWGIPVKNRTLIIAYLPDTDPTNPANQFAVTVSNNQTFMLQQGLPVIQTGARTFTLVGPVPQWRGKKLNRL
jgi:hypothetical protein